MKKRFLIPAVTVALLGGMAVHGSNIQKTCVPGNADYEAGTGICIAKNAFTANGQPQPAAAKVQAAPVASIESKFGPSEGALTIKQRTARANHHNLQAKCASHLSGSLKDPNSMKIIGGSYGAQGDRKVVVNLTYTATNSFGGRVQDSNSCIYNL